MEHPVLVERDVAELHIVKGMAQKNVAEKVSYQKRQKQIDRQKKEFVKQHSKDENELKLVLQRLQLEQQLHETEVDGLSDEEEIEETSSETSNDDSEEPCCSNPYPVIIVPKFGVTSPRPDKNGNKVPKFPARFLRKKSLEYEDVDKMKKTGSGICSTIIAASFISKLRSPFHKKTPDKHEHEENWCEQWETTASIRRPRKTVAELNQHKLLQRTKSDMSSRPSSSTSLQIAHTQTERRHTASKQNNRRPETLNIKDLEYEGTIEEGHLSPRGISKSRRGGSLKERKNANIEEDQASMRRCNSTKERRKKTNLCTKDKADIYREPQILSRKNSKEKRNDESEQPTEKSDLSEVKNSENSIKKHEFKVKHNRLGSLKERGEEKSSRSGIRDRIRCGRNIQQTASSKRKMTKRQQSLSTDSSPISSPPLSPVYKEKHFNF